MSQESTAPTELGPPPKPSVDWFFTPRPGRSLDAAKLRLQTDRAPYEYKFRLFDFIGYSLGLGRHCLKRNAKRLGAFFKRG